MANEVRLIDANKLPYTRVQIFHGMNGDTPLVGGYNAVVMSAAIREAPTIDPESLRAKGRWIKTKETLGYLDVDCVECSVCHDSWLADEDDSFEYLGHWHYCPNCGAKMEG